MPVVFGVEVGDNEEIDRDWDGQLIDNNTGKKVFDLSHQYVPPEQLFPSSRDGPILRNCHNCAAMMTMEELVQVKTEFYPQVNVDDIFNDMENKYRSEIVLFCYICVQRLTVTSDASCPSVLAEATAAYDENNNNIDWMPVAMEENENDDDKNNIAKAIEMTRQENTSDDNKNQTLNVVETIDSGEEMEDANTSDGEEKDVERMEEEDSGVDFSVEDTAFTCNICDSEFKTSEEFGKHTRTHERISAKKCPVCNAHLSTDTFYGHLEEHGRTIKGFIKELKKINRKETIKKLKIRKCSVCSWAFNSRSKMKKHKRDLHVKCVFCSKYFMDKKRYKKHVKKGKCNVYRQHKEKASTLPPQSKFPCTTCQRILYSQEDLTRHLKMHITFTKCRTCNSKVRSGEPFINHMRQHSIAPKANTTDASTLTSAPRQVADEIVSSYTTDERSSVSTTSECSISQEEVDMRAKATTWRQLSLQLKNKKPSVNGTNSIEISRSSLSSNNVVANNTNITNTTAVSNNHIRSNTSISNSSPISHSTNNRQPNRNKQSTTNDIHHPSVKVALKSKNMSSEKENKNQLPESEEEMILKKKFSLKSKTKRIYFKRSPDIMTILANKRHLQHTTNVKSCTP